MELFYIKVVNQWIIWITTPVLVDSGVPEKSSLKSLVKYSFFISKFLNSLHESCMDIIEVDPFQQEEISSTE